MTHSYIAYIDESGDDGLSHFRKPLHPGGASHWFSVGAMVLRSSISLEPVRWRNEILAATPNSKRNDVHFLKMSHVQKTHAVQYIAAQPVRLISIVSKKSEIPENTKEFFEEDRSRFYWFRCRYLIERLSWLCRDMRSRVPDGDGRVKIVFSRRGKMNYDNFKTYLYSLKSSYHNDVNIYWPVIDIDSVCAVDHSRNAGLQIADVAISSIHAAFEPDFYGNTEDRYLRAIHMRLYRRKGKLLSYGLKLLPNHKEIEYSDEHKKLLDFLEDSERPPGP